MARPPTQSSLPERAPVGHTQGSRSHIVVDLRRSVIEERRHARELELSIARLERTYAAIVRSLAAAMEAKDATTAGHTKRVTAYALRLLALISPDETDDASYKYGFLLHDIGKLGIPDAILGKPGPLAVDEWKSIRRHPQTGGDIIEGIEFLERAREIILCHHERWDGFGYPFGLRGEESPMTARLFAVADTFDAITSDRPYRAAASVEFALEEIRAGSGTQFWPAAVEALSEIPLEELKEIALT